MKGKVVLVLAGLAIAMCVIGTIAQAQTQAAKSAVVEISAGKYGGSGVLVDVVDGRYEGKTAAHVVENHKLITVRVGKYRYPATVVHVRWNGRVDVATFFFRSLRRHHVVAITERTPEIGERVWSAGYPGFTGRLAVRQGAMVPAIAGKDLAVGYRVANGDSGSPLFSRDGVVGVIGGNQWYDGHYAGARAWVTRCRLFGRRQCGPEGCTPGSDQGTNDPGPMIETPVDVRIEKVESPVDVRLLPPVQPKPSRALFYAVLAFIAVLAVGGVVFVFLRSGREAIGEHLDEVGL